MIYLSKKIPNLEKYKGLKMELSANRISYSIELTPAQWDKLDAADFEEVKKVWLKDTLAQDLEWNGHFGRNFFFSVSANSIEEMNSEAQKVVSVMENHLNDTPKRKLKK